MKKNMVLYFPNYGVAGLIAVKKNNLIVTNVLGAPETTVFECFCLSDIQILSDTSFECYMPNSPICLLIFFIYQMQG